MTYAHDAGRVLKLRDASPSSDGVHACLQERSPSVMNINAHHPVHHAAHAHAASQAQAPASAASTASTASSASSAASQPATIVRLSQAALSASHDADGDGDKK